jgi:phage tail sheath gpL-like
MSYFPSVNINLSSIQRDKLAELRPVIFVGQASGSNFETKIYKDILESDVNNKFGLNSALSVALLEAMRIGGSHDIYAVPLAEEVGSVAATSTITITGSVVNTSQIILTANSDVFSISVANDDTINEIATKLTNKINNTSRRLFGASVLNNVITLTFNQKGVIGNQLKYSITSLNSNYLSTNDIVIQSTGFAGGSGNIPSIENILSLLNDDVADIFFDSYLLQDAGNFNWVCTFVSCFINTK